MGTKWLDLPGAASLDLGTISIAAGSEIAVKDFFEDFVLVQRVYKDTPLEGDKKAEMFYDASMQLLEKLKGN